MRSVSRNKREGFYAGRLPTKIAKCQKLAVHSKHYRQRDRDERRYRCAITCWIQARREQLFTSRPD